MNEPKLISTLNALTRKGAELSHRANLLAETLKDGGESKFFLEMVKVSINDIDFWGSVLAKEIEAESDHDA